MLINTHIMRPIIYRRRTIEHPYLTIIFQQFLQLLVKTMAIIFNNVVTSVSRLIVVCKFDCLLQSAVAVAVPWFPSNLNFLRIRNKLYADVFRFSDAPFKRCIAEKDETMTKLIQTLSNEVIDRSLQNRLCTQPVAAQ